MKERRHLGWRRSQTGREMEDRKVLRGGNAGAKALRQEPPGRTEERLTKAGVAGAGRGSSAGEEVGRT